MADNLKVPQKILLDTKSPARTNYKRVLYTLEKLKYDDVPAMPGPKFIYAHIISPHPPFVFMPNGDFKFQAEEDTQGYANQVAFINQRIEEIVKDIIDHSAV